MARPIKDTPVLTGKDAERFAERLANIKPESEEVKRRGKEAYEALKAIASFDFH